MRRWTPSGQKLYWPFDHWSAASSDTHLTSKDNAWVVSGSSNEDDNWSPGSRSKPSHSRAHTGHAKGGKSDGKTHKAGKLGAAKGGKYGAAYPHFGATSVLDGSGSTYGTRYTSRPEHSSSGGLHARSRSSPTICDAPSPTP